MLLNAQRGDLSLELYPRPRLGSIVDVFQYSNKDYCGPFLHSRVQFNIL